MPKFVEAYLEIRCKDYKITFEITPESYEGGLFEWMFSQAFEILDEQVSFPDTTPVFLDIFSHDDGEPRKPYKVVSFTVTWKKDARGCAWAHIEGDVPYMGEI